MSSMINLKASKKTPTITVGVNPVTNIHVAEARSSTNVHYPGPDGVQESTAQVVERTVTVEDDKNALIRENKVLRIIIDILHSNPLIVNKYIIADDEKLMRMVALLCNASEVHIDADDVGCGCVSKNTYRKVHSIYVVVDGQTKNLKYDFSDVMYTLREFHISTKYVW